MGPEGFFRKPKLIIEAVLSQKTDVLKLSGRRGAEVTNKKRKITSDLREIETAIRLEKERREHAELLVSTNEDIISVDGEDFDVHPEDRFSTKE